MARVWAVLWVALVAVGAWGQPGYVWIEGEAPTTINVARDVRDGDPAVISGGQWLQHSLDEGQLDQLGDGLQLSYDFTAPAAGEYTLWLHLGLEFVRAPLEWRVGGGEWRTVSPDDLGVDLCGLGVWYEASWVEAGPVTLAAGAQTLELRATEPNGNRFLFNFDAACLVAGAWRPTGSLQPGQTPSGALDTAAATRTVPVAVPAGSDRAVTSLDGAWQVARWDDLTMDVDPYEPLPDAAIPADLVWRGVDVPSDLFGRPEFNFAHRVFYRTTLDVPAAAVGRAAYLDSDGANWIMTVFVNGQRVGWQRGTRMPWRLDLGPSLQAGANELVIAVKSPWYGQNVGEGESKNRRRNLPRDFWQHARQVGSFFPSTKGDTDGLAVGLTDPLRLVVCGGPVYVDEVFAQPRVVGGQRLTAEVTVHNAGAQPAAVEVLTSAVDDATGEVALTLPAVTGTAPAGASVALTTAADFPDAKLWWPGDNPAALYRLRTETQVGGATVDVREELFGFRDVTIEGKFIRINGVRRNFWNLLGGLRGATDEEKLAHFYAGNNRFERFGRDLAADLGPDLALRSKQLEWADRHGIPGRLSSMIDGMFITHELNNPDTWRFFAEQIEQMVRQSRNHPSVIVYSLENELLFITAALAYRGDIDRIEQDCKTYMLDVAHRWDPTRPSMFDGGGALQDNSVEICCTHYLEDGFQPDNAAPMGGLVSQRLWSWDEQRPYSAGEVAYFSGDNADHAWIGGESAAASKADARLAYGKYVRYMFERYRWNEVSMTHPWVAQDGIGEATIAMNELAAFTRYHNRTVWGGQPTSREVRVFNDTWSAEPLTFTWSFTVDGAQVAGAEQQITLEPGYAQSVNLDFTPPAVAARTEAQLRLVVTQPGAKSFDETQAWAVFPSAQPAVAGVQLTAAGEPFAHALYVLQEAGAGFEASLAAAGWAATAIADVAAAAPGGIIIVAPQYAGLKAATPALVAYAQAGGRVVCLEQAEPWVGDDLPAPLAMAGEGNNPEPVSAHFTFSQGQGLPLFDQLGPDDLSAWAGDEPTASALWLRPSGGARSWVAAGKALRESALIEVPLGPGQILATQLRVGSSLAIEPAARQLLANMLSVANAYAPPDKAVTWLAAGDYADFLGPLGLRGGPTTDLAASLDPAAHPILLVQGTAANLAGLLAQRAAVDNYWTGGGWLVVWGLEPDALAAYNDLLGTQHVMREFRTERVRLLRDPLTAGLDSPDVTQPGSTMMAPWANLRVASRDYFTTCVDAGPNIAPFCFGPVTPDREFTSGNGTLQLVNGLFNSDFWWYIDQIAYEQIPPAHLLARFPLPADTRLAAARIWNNANYDTAADVELRLDGQTVATTTLPDGFDSVEVDLGGAAAGEFSLYATSVRVRQDKKLVGLDELQLDRVTPAWAANGRVVPLTDVGGLVKYPRGSGGALLCNLKPTDEVAENIPLKQRVLSTLLANLGAAFGG